MLPDEPELPAGVCATSFETIGRQSFDHSFAAGLPSLIACGKLSAACPCAHVRSPIASGPDVRGANAGLPTIEPL